jgi:SSS family solute:Na+ symporter
MTFSIVLLVIFFTVMIGIGVWGMKKTVSLNDFFLGGRSIGPWVSALAYGTTYFSAVAFIGFAGKLGWVFGLHTMWMWPVTRFSSICRMDGTWPQNKDNDSEPGCHDYA